MTTNFIYIEEMNNTITFNAPTTTTDGGVGSFYVGDNCYPYGDWTWERYYPTYYPVYYETIKLKEDGYKKAFEVMKVLMKNGYFKKIKVEKYNKIIKEIADSIC